MRFATEYLALVLSTAIVLGTTVYAIIGTVFNAVEELRDIEG